MIKNFYEFINETYLENPVDAKLLDYNKKKMLKNGYIEVSVIKPIDDLKKDDILLVSSTEFGELDDNALITCYKNNKKIIIPKKNVIIKN